MYNVQSRSTARKRYHFTHVPTSASQPSWDSLFCLLVLFCFALFAKQVADEGSSRRLGHRTWGQRPSRAYSFLSPSRSSPRLISQRKDTEQTHVTHTHASSVASAKTHRIPKEDRLSEIMGEQRPCRRAVARSHRGSPSGSQCCPCPIGHTQ